MGQITFSSSSVAAVHCAAVMVPAGAWTAKWALWHWSGSPVVEPGSVHVPATHVVGAVVAHPVAQVVLVVPGSHVPPPEDDVELDDEDEDVLEVLELEVLELELEVLELEVLELEVLEVLELEVLELEVLVELLELDEELPPETVREVNEGRPDPFAQKPKEAVPPLAPMAAFQLSGVTVRTLPTWV
jgi:hypothetical protein